MDRTSRLFGTTLALVCLVAPHVRANQLTWTYEGSGTTVVNADHPGDGGVSFTYDPKTTAIGDTQIPVANLWTFSTATSTTPDKFTGAPYDVSLTLTDGLSGQSGTATFTGALSGTLSDRHALLANSVAGGLTQALTLGTSVYTVTLGAFAPPGPPSSSNSGSLSALVTITPATVPEPSTLLLAGIGCAGAGLVGWCRRRSAGRPA
ncbi:MAG: PEP-CTERM sorting domain-containing protein [Gemmataceae bacterium]|nr:PEP-CTERM sorting domain-containing protein [Gemmataceae bacterium]